MKGNGNICVNTQPISQYQFSRASSPLWNTFYYIIDTAFTNFLPAGRGNLRNVVNSSILIKQAG